MIAILFCRPAPLFPHFSKDFPTHHRASTSPYLVRRADEKPVGFLLPIVDHAEGKHENFWLGNYSTEKKYGLCSRRRCGAAGAHAVYRSLRPHPERAALGGQRGARLDPNHATY